MSLLISHGVWCQNWSHEGTIALNQTITSYSIDQQGYLYIGTRQGEVYRYLTSGLEDEHFSAIGNAPVTTLEASNRLKPFLYYRDTQQFTFLDRFTTTPVTYEVSNFQSDLAWLVTPGTDNSIWILASTFNELRKFNIQTKALILTTPLSIDLSNAAHMRSYQNLTIISDKQKGLYFFDQYGNLLDQQRITGITQFYIYQKKIIALSDRGILKIDPFSPEKQETIKAPNGAFKGVLNFEEVYFLIQEASVQIYRHKS